VCSVFGCPPFPSTAPNAIVSGGYPSSLPFRRPITIVQNGVTLNMTVTVGIYNNPGDSGGLFVDNDQAAVVVSRCSDDVTLQVRQVQSLIAAPIVVTDDYLGQAGRGMRNQGNANNQ
jgi:hypothetical protein